MKNIFSKRFESLTDSSKTKTIADMNDSALLDSRISERKATLKIKKDFFKDAEKLRTVVINLIEACEEREGDDGERCYLVPAQEFDDLQELVND